jgi:hypothetical protein
MRNDKHIIQSSIIKPVRKLDTLCVRTVIN